MRIKSTHTKPLSCNDCRHQIEFICPECYQQMTGICSLVDDELPLAMRTVMFQRSSGFLRDCGPGGVFWEPRE